MDLSAVLDFFAKNLLATYGAAVGTLALGLNFMRYRHAVSSSKIRLKLEVLPFISEDEFSQEIDSKLGELLFLNHPEDGRITHRIKVRNIGSVSAHIEDVWLDTQYGIKRPERLGSIEISPRSSCSFEILSLKNEGYIHPKRAFVLDETGKKWRS